MGRRNYDLTGITPGSPAWKVQQERKHRRAGLSGPAPINDSPSTPTGCQNHITVDEDQTPRALPRVLEEEADDRTPTVANFPANTGRLQGQCTMLREASETSTFIDPGAASQRPDFDIERRNDDLPAQPPVRKPRGPVTNDEGLAAPTTHREVRVLEFQNDVALSDSYNVTPSNSLEVPSWQPMTMEDFRIGNLVLQGLAAQGCVGAPASCFEDGLRAIIGAYQIRDSGEDTAMGENCYEKVSGTGSS